MRATLQITTPKNKIEQEILKRFTSHVTTLLNLSSPIIRSQISLLVKGVISESETYQSLMNGDLRGHMGLENPETVLPAIVDKIADGVKVWVEKPKIVGRKIEGGLSIGLLRSDYQDILSVGGTSYVSPPSGREITWLRWMLFDSVRVVIANHGIDFSLDSDQKKRSRSGMALMFPGGGGWHVPAAASGTEDDNFLTRILNEVSFFDQMSNIIRREIQRRM